VILKSVLQPSEDFYRRRDPRQCSSRASSVKLPMFWVATLAGWFRSVEAQFAVKDITSEMNKYFLALVALSEPQVDKVMAVTEEEPKEESYGRLKAALVASNTLMPFQ
jgi:hypothetical protein